VFQRFSKYDNVVLGCLIMATAHLVGHMKQPWNDKQEKTEKLREKPVTMSFHSS
jgi:uncharacterized metal-binding protein